MNLIRKKRRITQDLIVGILLGIPPLVLIGILLYLLSTIIITGFSYLEPQKLFMSIIDGGYLEAILGTILLLVGGILFALPPAMATAIYLSEYASRSSRIVRAVELAINTLASIPSIVLGLFGLALFVKIMGFGISLISGWLTLSIMVLPILTRSIEEALKMVPREFREVAISLGASRWQATTDIVLPAAGPGIITGIVLGLLRVAGETAAILFTACVLTAVGIPISPLQPVISLTYYLFVLLFTSPDPTYSRAFTVASILLLIIIILDIALVVLRRLYRGHVRVYL